MDLVEHKMLSLFGHPLYEFLKMFPNRKRTFWKRTENVRFENVPKTYILKMHRKRTVWKFTENVQFENVQFENIPRTYILKTYILKIYRERTPWKFIENVPKIFYEKYYFKLWNHFFLMQLPLAILTKWWNDFSFADAELPDRLISLGWNKDIFFLEN